jgi:hypothetical protein
MPAGGVGMVPGVGMPVGGVTPGAGAGVGVPPPLVGGVTGVGDGSAVRGGAGSDGWLVGISWTPHADRASSAEARSRLHDFEDGPLLPII